MKYLFHYGKVNEKLTVSPDIMSMLEDLRREDKVAALLYKLTKNEFYPSEKNLNNLEFAEELNKIAFVPTNRRSSGWPFDSTSMPTKIGRVVKEIYGQIEKYLKVKLDTEIFIEDTTRNLHIWIHPEINIEKMFCYLPTNINSIFPHSTLNINIKGHWKNSELSQKSSQIKNLDIEFVNNAYVSYQEAQWNTGSVEQIEGTSYITLHQTNKLDNLISKKSGRSQNLQVELELISNLFLTDADIEIFYNKVIAYQKQIAKSAGRIEIVKGEGIRKWYLMSNYSEQKGQLGKSCMRYEHCQSYLDIYCENPENISLVIIRDQNGLLNARALLWKFDNGNFFLDRTYCIHQSDDILLRNWARGKGYFYWQDKKILKNNFQIDIDPVLNEKMKLYVSLDKWKFKEYPYSDTLETLNYTKGILSVDKLPSYKNDKNILLDSVNGKYTLLKQKSESGHWFYPE